ncbi:hypothetical protein BU16DRAFT_457452 [Lophium mytilinum]|uniref:Required for respiratory growth protein 9, mitochondrial n=1 Tax=Lophium mytilinum TaxID=390894 RepID=A0A6A6R1Z1_9PEZI|nr:hypothetical protein BU16DRAFT_457452 [Lophium mytilinum]
MACSNCSKRTLELFLRGAAGIDTSATLRPSLHRNFATARYFSAGAQWTRRDDATPNLSIHLETLSSGRPAKAEEPVVKEPWMINKAALQKKFGGEKWNPRKKLSPDTMDGIRHLHKQSPDKFTTPVLAEHFKISPEAIRRILKSNWKPSDEEYEDRMRRWEKRGETIWSNLVDLGVRPPKKWRDMGVGKAERGNVPKWKTRWRNQVAVSDNIDDIPLVDEGPGHAAWEEPRPIAERIM